MRQQLLVNLLRTDTKWLTVFNRRMLYINTPHVFGCRSLRNTCQDLNPVSTMKKRETLGSDIALQNIVQDPGNLGFITRKQVFYAIEPCAGKKRFNSLPNDIFLG